MPDEDTSSEVEYAVVAAPNVADEVNNAILNTSGAAEGYNFRGVNLKNADIDVATEVFTRLNVGGKELTLFEIMVAKTYDGTRGFDLAEKYEALMKELETVNYETISSSTVLRVVSMLLAKDVTRKQILKLPKKDFIDTWDKAVDSIKLS